MRPQWIVTSVRVILMAACMVLAATGILEKGLAQMGLGTLSRSNHHYLEESYDRALEGFLVLSAVKSGLAVIEGSEVGIGFNLQVGDLVQSVYDYVNIAWKTVLAGGTILIMTRLAMDGVAMVDHYILVLAFFFLLMLTMSQSCFPAWKGLTRFMHLAAATFTFMAVLLYLVLPLAVFGASYLSERITQPLIQQSYDTFDQVNRTFSSEVFGKDVSVDGKETSAMETAMGLGERYERLKKRVRETEAYFSERAKSLAGTTFQLIAGYLFDCVVFPLAFVAVLILFLKGIPGYLGFAQK